MLTTRSENSLCRASVGGELTIYEAAGLRDELLRALEGHSVLELDLSGVSGMDTAGLQVIMALKKTGRARGVQVTLSHHSEAVTHAIQLFDLAQYFGDPMVLTGGER